MEYFLTANKGAPFHFGEPTDTELVARVYANRNRELFRTHPGHRCPDLRARTEEEQRLLREWLNYFTLRLDERLHREDNI